MSTTPENIKQWADEAYVSFEKALMLFKDEFPVPTEEQKMELVKFATPFAAMNRDIRDDAVVKEAYNYVLKQLDEELEVTDQDEIVQYSTLFLLAYLDSHVAFRLLGEKEAEDVMEFLCKNYKINEDIG